MEVQRAKLWNITVIEDACGGSSPHPQTISPSNLRILWPSSPSQGSAGRGQGENDYNDFRCEFFLLDTRYAATNAEVHEKSNAEIMFFLRFGHDFGGPGASRRQLRRQCQTRHQKISDLTPLWEVFLEHFGSQIWFLCILFVTTFMLIFGIAFGRPPAPI